MESRGKYLSAPENSFAVLRMAALPVIALVCAVNAQAATLSISANPMSVSTGAASTLTWTSTGAASCAASGAWSGVKATSGSQSVTAPNGLSTYALNCSGPGGSASNSVVIGAGTTPPALYALNLTLSGSGTVTSSPAGISCGTTCSASYASGTSVTLTATPNSGYSFTGWSGACPGTGTCSVTMSQARNISATFSLIPVGGSNPITLSLVPARTSGVAPLSVFFDASGTTDTSVTSRPFHDLEYRWNFGDSTTGTWAYGAHPGTSKNTATGPVAVHVFETPGTYTVSMTAYDGTNTNTTTTIITVTDPNTVFAGTNTICISSTLVPTPGVDGCPLGAAVYQQANFYTAIQSYALTGKRVLFRHDDIFTTGGSARMRSTGPGVVGMYGSGAKPKIQPTTTATGAFILFGQSNIITMQDWRVMDLEFDGQSNNGMTGFGANGNAEQMTLLRMDVHNMGSGVSYDDNVLNFYSGNGYMKSFDQMTIADSSFRVFRGGIGFYIAAKHLAIIGNIVEDTNGGTAQHVVRIMHSGPGVMSNNTMGYPPPTKQVFTLRGAAFSSAGCTNGCTSSIYPYGLESTKTNNTIVSDNKFISGNTAQPVGVEPSDANYWDIRFHNIIFERNWYTATAGDCCFPMLKIAAQEVTVRNELIDTTNGLSHRAIGISGAGTASPTSSNVRIYNNTIFSNDTVSQPDYFGPVGINSAATGVTVVNNLAYSPKINGTFSINAVATSSNNTISTQTNPFFAATPPTGVADFKIGVGSYAIGAGKVVPVWSDFFLVPQTATRSLGAVKGN